MTEVVKPHRSIRSFVRREGRMTPAQRRALEVLWPRYRIETGDAPLDFAVIFGRCAPLILEIGFGNGDALVAEAATHPEKNYIGIEVHRPGIGNLLRKLESLELKNARAMLADAKDVLAAQIPETSLSGIHIFFPDPWPKQRHHKRRLVQPDFAALVMRKLVPGGYIHLATDWKDYADHMFSVLTRTPGLVEVSELDEFRAMMATRGQTRFERRGRKMGNQIWDLVFQRTN
jgi:tRNA (guanine-N7-)-methyltransferase